MAKSDKNDLVTDILPPEKSLLWLWLSNIDQIEIKKKNSHKKSDLIFFIVSWCFPSLDLIFFYLFLVVLCDSNVICILFKFLYDTSPMNIKLVGWWEKQSSAQVWQKGVFKFLNICHFRTLIIERSQWGMNNLCIMQTQRNVSTPYILRNLARVCTSTHYSFLKEKKKK